MKKYSKSERKKRKSKVKLKSWVKKTLVFIILITIIAVFLNNINKDTIIKKISYSKDELLISYKSRDDNIYCLFYTKDDTPTLEDENWIKGENNKCNIKTELNNNYKIYLKNDEKIVYKYNKSIVYYFKINEEYDYISTDNDYNIDYSYLSINKDPSEIEWITSDNEIASIENGIIHPIKSGEITIKGKFDEYNDEFNIILTDLIVSSPKNYDYTREYLSCDQYTKEENDIIDKILKFKIDKVGYKTRAGVVEAARFLTLNFPYKIDYAYENGRVTTNGVDGEGRYYHIGLFLDESRFDSLNKSRKGPKTWGCSIYSTGKLRYQSNGLDCSGFVSWAIFNGGFDIKDVGAGFSTGSDLTDFGELKKLTKELSNSDEIKVGDLLHSEAAGGHIAIIIGIDEEKYYVAQALWYDETGVIISEYEKDKLPNSFPHVILMDKYYIEDGDYTKMWY